MKITELKMPQMKINNGSLRAGVISGAIKQTADTGFIQWTNG